MNTAGEPASNMNIQKYSARKQEDSYLEVTILSPVALKDIDLTVDECPLQKGWYRFIRPD